MSEWLPYILGVLALATPYVTWRIARRQTSGSAGTTDAATLWKEGTAIRQEAIARAERLQAAVDELRDTIALLEKQNAEQMLKLVKLQTDYAVQQREMETLKQRLDNGGIA